MGRRWWRWGGGTARDCQRPRRDDERRECENVEKQVGKLASAATLLLFHPFPQFSLQDIGVARKADPNQAVVYLLYPGDVPAAVSGETAGGKMR